MLRLTALFGAALLTTGTLAAQAPTLPANLTAARAGLERYQSVINAVHDGYLSTVGCISYPRGMTEGDVRHPAGAMGVHLLNLGYVGQPLDPARPQVLIYEPVGDSLRLVAAEWFVPVAVAGSQRPSIFGQAMNGPMEGHAPIMPAELHHYDLHVWLWKENPAGVFSPTNPAVSCPAGAYTFNEDSPRMVGGHNH